MAGQRRFASPFAAPVIAGAVAALFVCWFALEIGGRRATLIFDDWGQAVVPAVIAVLCWRTARREQGRARRAWLFIGLGVAFWSLGEVAWSVYETILDVEVPFPSFADIGFLGLPVFAAIGVLSLPAAPSRTASKVRSVMDGLTIATAMLFVSWATVLGPVYRASGGSIFERVMSLAYPMSDAVLVSLVVFAAARAPRAGVPSHGLLAAGLFGIAVADSGFAYLATLETYQSGNWIDLGWVMGFLLIGLGATSWITPAQQRRESAGPSLASAALPYATVLLALVAGGARATGGGLDLVLIPVGSAMVLLVFARQFLTLADRVTLEEELTRQAFEDTLTGLANRARFRERVAAALDERRLDGREVALVFVDVDDFKTINDGFGHQSGDLLLSEIATRMRDAAPDGATVARLGGDEFALLIEGHDEERGVAVAERLLDDTGRTATIAGSELSVGISVGVAHAGPAGETVDDLLRSADVAMYTAKANGKGRLEVYQQRMHERVLERAQLQADLRAAVDRREFEALFQPVFDLREGTVVGMETLLRWRHPMRGLLSPGDFIELAEDGGQIGAIGRWVIDEALQRAASLRSRLSGEPGRWVGVNLSVRQAQDPRLVDHIVGALSASGLAPGDLMLEITETALMREPERTLGVLRDLRSLGVQLAIDDFGTGYASLSYLDEIPVDVLKIDRRFIRTIAGPAGAASLAHLVVRIGSTLGLRTIAEGIETPEQLAQLRLLGCDYGQGFHLAPPADLDSVEALIRTGRPWPLAGSGFAAHLDGTRAGGAAEIAGA